MKTGFTRRELLKLLTVAGLGALLVSRVLAVAIGLIPKEPMPG